MLFNGRVARIIHHLHVGRCGPVRFRSTSVLVVPQFSTILSTATATATATISWLQGHWHCTPSKTQNDDEAKKSTSFLSGGCAWHPTFIFFLPFAGPSSTTKTLDFGSSHVLDATQRGSTTRCLLYNASTKHTHRELTISITINDNNRLILSVSFSLGLLKIQQDADKCPLQS